MGCLCRLEGFSGLINGKAARLVQRLRPAAEDGSLLDLQVPVHDLTLEVPSCPDPPPGWACALAPDAAPVPPVFGAAAFGVDLAAAAEGTRTLREDLKLLLLEIAGPQTKWILPMVSATAATFCESSGAAHLTRLPPDVWTAHAGRDARRMYA